LRELIHRAIYEYDSSKISLGYVEMARMLVHRWSMGLLSTKSLRALGLPSSELLESQHFEAISV
jgi:hypothetical protein